MSRDFADLFATLFAPINMVDSKPAPLRISSPAAIEPAYLRQVRFVPTPQYPRRDARGRLLEPYYTHRRDARDKPICRMPAVTKRES